MTSQERIDFAASRKKEMNCCQAVLVAFADRLGKREDELLRLGSGFGSGMGTMEGTCGALVCVDNNGAKTPIEPAAVCHNA
jgi:hypothetical protein